MDASDTTKEGKGEKPKQGNAKTNKSSVPSLYVLCRFVHAIRHLYHSAGVFQMTRISSDTFRPMNLSLAVPFATSRGSSVCNDKRKLQSDCIPIVLTRKKENSVEGTSFTTFAFAFAFLALVVGCAAFARKNEKKATRNKGQNPHGKREKGCHRKQVFAPGVGVAPVKVLCQERELSP